MMVPVKHLMAPAAALALSGWWIMGQRQTLGEIESDSAAWRVKIAAARSGSDGEGATTEPSLAARARTQAARDRGHKADWRSIAARIRLRPGDAGADLHAMVSLQKILRGLSAAELAAGLEEIEGMDLTDEERRGLGASILGILVQKDPQLALDRFAARVNDDRNGVAWLLANGFREWSGKDPAAAIAWMDQRVAEGLFDSKALDGRCASRLRFEASLLDLLAVSDPAAAAARLAEFPENQRANLFRESRFLKIQPGNGRAIADLIRNGVPADQRLATLAKASGQLARQGDLEKITGFLGEIQPSDDERAAIVREAVKNRLAGGGESGGGIGETRAWIVAQAPRDAERLSGEALAGLVGSRGFGEMAKLALGYRDRSGSDDALVAFLEHAPDASRSEILDLAANIRDPAQRDEVTRRFINNPNRERAPASP